MPILHMVAAVALLAAAAVDFFKKIIPDALVVIIALCGAVRILPFPPEAGLLFGVFGMLAGGGLFLAVFIIGRQALKREALGLGDVKLMAAAGVLLGWKLILLAAVLAVLAGGIVAAVGLATRRLTKEDEIPFGPMLALGCLTALCFGDAILAWYLRLGVSLSFLAGV